MNIFPSEDVRSYNSRGTNHKRKLCKNGKYSRRGAVQWLQVTAGGVSNTSGEGWLRGARRANGFSLQVGNTSSRNISVPSIEGHVDCHFVFSILWCFKNCRTLQQSVNIPKISAQLPVLLFGFLKSHFFLLSSYKKMIFN